MQGCEYSWARPRDCMPRIASEQVEWSMTSKRCATDWSRRRELAQVARRMNRIRLAIIATHPIQYYAPLFQLLSGRGRVECHVFYGWSGGAFGAVQDPGFGRSIEWDIPLLQGYPFTFVANESTDPGTHHWGGIRSSQL